MAEVYANLIRRGRKTIEQVPEHLREEVKAILAADGNGLLALHNEGCIDDCHDAFLLSQ